jgi:hypothetical protein
MSTIGVARRWERGSRIGSRIGFGHPLLALSVCLAALVFGAFFGIGRLTRPGKGIHVEGAASLPAAYVSGAVPSRLASVPPLELSLLPPAPPRPRVTRRAQPFSPPPAVAPLQSATSAASPRPAPVPPESSTPTPSVPERSAPRSEPVPSTHSSGGGSSSSGGGTFESSG